MKQMPQIHKYMTPMPHTIGGDIEIKKALGMMREYQVRHLPVLTGGKLIGILTDRDLKLAAAFSDSENLTVEEMMTAEPYSVLPEAPIDQVVLAMAERKYGCAVVQQANGKVVGIFTANDGLRVLAEQLGSFYKHTTDAGVRANQ